MKLWIVIGLFVLICTFSISISQDYDDTRIITAEGWRDGGEVSAKGEVSEVAEEDETTKRTRSKNGRRRRRLRKRPRTTEAPTGEGKEILDGAEQTAEENPDKRKIFEETEQTPEEYAERRKIAQDGEVSEDTPKRRPGKRRRRPHRRYQDEKTDASETPKQPRRRRKNGRKRKPIEVTEEQPETTIIPEIQEINEQIQEITTTSTTTTTTTTTTTEAPIEVSENTVLKQEEKEPESVTIKYEQKNEDKVFGNKIFDRRNLFSKSRRLPETSAIIRKKLAPQKVNTESFNLRIINPLANLESHLDMNEVTSKINVPEGITDLPEIISPKTLIEKLKLERMSTTEEPNYPKFESQKEHIKKLLNSRRSTTSTTTSTTTTTTTEPAVTPKNVEQETTTEKLQETTVKPVLFESDIINKFNTSNLNDSILELLRTEGTRISKILESRNMTLNQLLEHRERGSSKFHLSDMFPKKDDLKEETTTVKEEIQFPNDDVMGLFPKFISDEIEKHTQQKKEEERREPRVFESMPEFTTKGQERKPTWRIIPNPKLTPVSEQGDFEEIKITDIGDKGNEIEGVFLDDEDNELKKISDSFSAETIITHHNSLSPLKKIPVSVKSAIIISGAILALAIFIFLSVLISCRVRQKKARLRAKQDILCEHLQNEDFMTSQQSLSPVLNKQQRGPVFTQGIHSNTTSNRHYYLWRTLRKTFQYD